MEFATLGIRIDTGDAKAAVGDLDKLTQAGARVEKSAQGVATAGRTIGASLGGTSKASKDAARSIDDYVRKLEISARTISMNAREAKLYELSLKGATRAQLEAANSALRMTDAYKSGQEIGQRIRTSLSVGAAAFGAAAIATVSANIKMLDSLDDLAEKTGLTAERLSELRYAGEVTGTSFGALGGGLSRLSKLMAEAAGGNKEALATFKALNVEVKNADGTLRDADGVLQDLANRFASYEDGASKSALAQRVFGRSGEEMLPILNQGAAGMQRLANEAKRLGAVYSSDTAKAAADFSDNLTRVKLGAEGAAVSITGGLIKSLANLSTEFLEARKNGGLFEAGMKSYSSWVDSFWSGRLFSGDTAPKSIEQIQAYVNGMGGPSAGGGRGFVNPRVVAPVVSDPTKSPGGSKKSPFADADQYLSTLQKQLQATKNLSVYETLLADIRAGRLGKLREGQQTEIEGIAKQIDAARALKESLDGQARARERTMEMQDRADNAAIAEVEGILSINQALREEIEEIGLENSARIALEKARLSNTIALKEENLVMLQNAGASATQIVALEREIELLRQRSGLLGRKEAALIGEEEKQSAKEFSDELNRDLKSAFMSAFQSTKNPIRAFGDSLFATVNARVSAAIAESLAKDVLGAIGMGNGGKGGNDWLKTIANIGMSYFTGGASVNLGTASGADLSMFFAKGGVVSSPSLSAYSGQVVSQPTVFPFAKGIGLMGEAGPEAILPLKRGRDGKLGVESGGGGTTVNQTINFNHTGQVDRRTQTQLARVAGTALQRGTRNS